MRRVKLETPRNQAELGACELHSKIRTRAATCHTNFTIDVLPRARAANRCALFHLLKSQLSPSITCWGFFASAAHAGGDEKFIDENDGGPGVRLRSARQQGS